MAYWFTRSDVKARHTASVMLPMDEFNHGCVGLWWLLGISDQKRHVEKRLIKETRGANVELAGESLLNEGC